MARLSALGRAALELAHQGFPVFPVKNRGKTPLTPHGHLDATTDPERVRSFWENAPEANIGLAVPSGYVVVDVDQPGALTQLKAEDRPLPTTATSRTGRGYHFIFRTGGEFRNSVGLLPGVDLRGVGGYIVVPPSIHPSGTRYRWEVPLSSTTVTEAPQWLLETALARGCCGCRPAEHWRQVTAEGVGEGERNNTVASLAGHLLRKGVDPFVAMELLLCWNQVRSQPPLSQREVSKTVDSIAGQELRRRGANGG